MTTATGNKVERRERGTGGGEHARAREYLRFLSPVSCSLRARRAPGFTLIEMLAVIVLIAIAVSVAAVSLHGRSRGQLVAAAQTVAAGLRDTRTRAMATGKPQWFTLDLRAHTFTVPGRSPRGLPPQATVHATSPASDAGPGVARIGYFPDGSSSGGHVTLTKARRASRVDVDWLTGAVTVSTGAVQ